MAASELDGWLGVQVAELGDKVLGKYVALRCDNTIVGIGNNPHSAMMDAESQGHLSISTRFIPRD